MTQLRLCVCVSEFKALKSYSRNRFSRSLSLLNSYPTNTSLVGGDDSEDEFSGMGSVPNSVGLPNSLKVTHRWVCVCQIVWCHLCFMVSKLTSQFMFLSPCRCSILSNATIKCDTGVYKNLQAWKDHKLHIDHEVTRTQTPAVLFCHSLTDLTKLTKLLFLSD